MNNELVIMYTLLAVTIILVARSVYVEYKLRFFKEKIRGFEERVRVLEELLRNAECFREIQDKDLKFKSKVRKRYIVFRVLCDKKPEGYEVETAIINTLARLYGEPFINKAMINVVYYDKERMKGIIRTTSEYKDNIIAGIGFVRCIGGSKALVIPIKTTGTIKRARDYIYGCE